MKTHCYSIFTLMALLLSGSCLAANVTVTANSSLTFTPQHVTINPGDTVTFTNQGGMHNVAADDGSFRCANGCDGEAGDGGYGDGGSGSPASNAWSVTLTFNTPGTIGYHCEVHGAPGTGMFGTITVANTSPPPITLGGFLSGNWYDPAQSGHGFQLEFTSSQNTFVGIWFVYAPDGSGPYWIYSQGTFDPDSDSVTVPAFLLGGAAFPPNFNPADVTTTEWGTMTFTFSDCTHGAMSWESVLPEYGSGSMPLTRLTQIAGTQCPEQ